MNNGNFVPLPGRDHSDKPHVVSEMEIDPVTMEDLWARELYELGTDEREATYNNLHAIQSPAVDETPEQLSRAMHSMQEEIDQLPDKNKRGHIRGLELDSMYIQSLSFRLKFLRSVQFDQKTAATRYCNCLDLLSELFGESALTRRLFITDLSEEEINYMKEGQYQVLPSRDCLGRRIVVYNLRSTTKTYQWKAMFKVYVYMLHAIVTEDVSTQKHGLVFISIVSLNHKFLSMQYSTADLHKVHRLYAATPAFWGAVHLCIPDEAVYRQTAAFFMALLGQRGRKTMRLHQGNRIEWMYSLRSFGLPVNEIPQMHSGEIKRKNNLRLMKVRMVMDEWQTEQERRFKARRRSKSSAPDTILPFPGIECPEINFVIISYHKHDNSEQNNHPGNKAFRKVLAQNESFKTFFEDNNASEFDRHSKIIQNVDDIIFDALLEGLHFVIYDKEKGYYSEVVSQPHLRECIKRTVIRYRSKLRAISRSNNCRASASSIKVAQEPFDLSDNNKMDCCGGPL